MMSIFKNTKLMGGIVVAAAVLAVGYYYWSNNSSSAAPAVTTADSGSTPASQDLLTLLGSLHSIQLDPAIFTDPNFEALTDFGVTIPDEPVGRPDPFAPVGSASSAASTQTPPATPGTSH